MTPGLIATIPEGIGLESPPREAPDGTIHTSQHAVHWSPDGTQVAYIGEKDGKTHPVVGDEVHDSFHYISAPDFGARGDQVLFRVGNRSRSMDRETWWVLLDGKLIGKEDWIGEVSCSLDGNHIAYWTQPGAKIERSGAYNRGDQVLVVWNRKGEKWKRARKGKKWDDALSLSQPSFSADGSLAASVAMKNGRWHVLLVSKGRGKLEAVLKGMPSALALDPAGKRWAVTGFNPEAMIRAAAGGGGFGTGMAMMIQMEDGVLGADYESAGCPVFSPKGKRIAFKVKRGASMGILVDGDKAHDLAYDYVHTPVWHPKGKRLAYGVTIGGSVNPYWELLPAADRTVSGGQSYVVQHAARGKRSIEKGASWDMVRHVTFSPDGEHLAYAAKTEQGWTMVVDEQPGEFHDELGPPRFSGAGAQVAFGARSGRDLMWKVR